jgi:hypothetical protein
MLVPIFLIGAVESLGPPFIPLGFKRGTFDLIKGLETTSNLYMFRRKSALKFIR